MSVFISEIFRIWLELWRGCGVTDLDKLTLRLLPVSDGVWRWAAVSRETCGSGTPQTTPQDWAQMFIWCKSEQIRRCWWTLAALFARLGANMFNVLVARYLFSCCEPHLHKDREGERRWLQLQCASISLIGARIDGFRLRFLTSVTLQN